MTMTDPIADMLTRVRNAITAHHESVLIPASRMKVDIARILKDEGFIRDYELIQDTIQGTLKIWLNYTGKREPVMSGLRRISKPGLRVYAKSKEMPRVLNGLGIAIVSTPRGIMTGQQARRNNIGGEVLCYVW